MGLHSIIILVRWCLTMSGKTYKFADTNENEYNFDKNIHDTIRKNIKKYRNEKNMTAAKLAEHVGLSHEFIRQIESEKIAYNPSVETLYKISVVLEITLDQLIEGQE